MQRPSIGIYRTGTLVLRFVFFPPKVLRRKLFVRPTKVQQKQIYSPRTSCTVPIAQIIVINKHRHLPCCSGGRWLPEHLSQLHDGHGGNRSRWCVRSSSRSHVHVRRTAGQEEEKAPDYIHGRTARAARSYFREDTLSRRGAQGAVGTQSGLERRTSRGKPIHYAVGYIYSDNFPCCNTLRVRRNRFVVYYYVGVNVFLISQMAFGTCGRPNNIVNNMSLM